jgi:hypothetical protein
VKKSMVLGLAVGCIALASQFALAANLYSINFDDSKSFCTTLTRATDDQGPYVLGVLTTAKAEVVAGTSFKLDSLASEEEWNEMYWSDWSKIKFEANKTYTVDFDYKILDDEGAYFYFLMRSYTGRPGGDDRGWTTWTGDSETGHQSVTFELADHDDYYINIGNHFKGSQVIDNITVREGE